MTNELASWNRLWHQARKLGIVTAAEPPTEWWTRGNDVFIRDRVIEAAGKLAAERNVVATIKCPDCAAPEYADIPEITCCPGCGAELEEAEVAPPAVPTLVVVPTMPDPTVTVTKAEPAPEKKGKGKPAKAAPVTALASPVAASLAIEGVADAASLDEIADRINRNDQLADSYGALAAWENGRLFVAAKRHGSWKPEGRPAKLATAVSSFDEWCETNTRYTRTRVEQLISYAETTPREAVIAFPGESVRTWLAASREVKRLTAAGQPLHSTPVGDALVLLMGDVVAARAEGAAPNEVTVGAAATVLADALAPGVGTAGGEEIEARPAATRTERAKKVAKKAPAKKPAAKKVAEEKVHEGEPEGPAPRKGRKLAIEPGKSMPIEGKIPQDAIIQYVHPKTGEFRTSIRTADDGTPKLAGLHVEIPLAHRRTLVIILGPKTATLRVEVEAK